MVRSKAVRNMNSLLYEELTSAMMIYMKRVDSVRIARSGSIDHVVIPWELTLGHAHPLYKAKHL